MRDEYSPNPDLINYINDLPAETQALLLSGDDRSLIDWIHLGHIIDPTILADLAYLQTGTLVYRDGRLCIADQPETVDHAPTEHALRTRDLRRKKRLIIARDGPTCRICGSNDRPSLDHIWPQARGGTDDLDNLQILCSSCNSRKGARV